MVGAMGKLFSRVYRSALIRYGVTGVLTVSVDLGGLVLLHQVFGVEVYVAATLSFWASLGVNFVLNKLWTFHVRSHTTQQAMVYGCLVFVNYMTGLAMIDFFTVLGFGYIYGKIAALAMTTIWNFILYKKVIFIKRPVGRLLRASKRSKKLA